MSRVCLETEHQELFYLNADLHAPIAIHIPSALARLGYYVCLRVPVQQANELTQVMTRLKVAGLRPDDVLLPQGEGLEGTARVPSTADGQVWVVLCRARVSRGDGELDFANIPPAIQSAHVLLCTWLRFVESGQADSWIACQADPAWAPNGVPLGGIGTGKVEISRDGRFRNYSGNNNQDMPFEEPDGLDGAYLSLACDNEERLLATRAMNGIAPCADLSADLAFPQGCLRAPRIFPDIDVAVTLAGPIIPHDLRLSSIPGFVLRWQVTNHGAASKQVTCRLAWPNLVGMGGGIGEPETRVGYADGSYRFWEAPEGHKAEALTGAGFEGLCYINTPSEVCAAADGSHYVATAGTGVEIHADSRCGAVARTVTVPAGECAQVDMAVVWAMGQYVDILGIDRGLYWQNHFADGPAMVAELFSQMDHILTQGRALRELLEGTDLPRWMTRRLVNSCYPLVTNSVLYRDGRFSINEGPTEMAGCYGTIDQRLGAHPATQLLYPDLNRTELELFGACQAENGGINHDLGHGHLEESARDRGWPDIPCSFIIQNAKHAWLTNDQTFAQAAWERSKRALRRHAVWAERGQGVAQVGGADKLGTSYDGYHYEGTTPYMATLWLAALRISRAWAEAQGDTEPIPKMEAWLKAAEERLEADLWNGEYYRAFGSAGGAVNENAHAGMLAGEPYARALCGEDVLPSERLDACAQAFLRLHGNPCFKVPPDEVTPTGEVATEYGWLPYVEAFGLAALACRGEDKILPIWERMIQAYNQDGRTPCDTRLMYRPLTGETSWGAYYMTAPASWLVYEALLDFVYFPASGVLRLHPVFTGSFAVVHPLFWATGTREGHEISLTVERVFQERLEVTALDVPKDAGGVEVDGTASAGKPGRGAYTRVALPNAWPVRKTARLVWSVEC